MASAKTFKKLFDSVKRSTPDEAVKVLYDVLSWEIKFHCDDISWNALYRCIEAGSRERKWKSKEAGHLVALLRSRAEREDWARWLDNKPDKEPVELEKNPSPLDLYRKLENRSPRELAAFIADKFRFGDGKRPILQGEGWDGLLNFVRAAQPSSPTVSADTLYSVLLFMRGIERRKQSHTDALFMCCSLCWRPVPLRFMGNGRIFCQFHNYRKVESLPPHKKAYERGSKIAAALDGRRRTDIEERLHALVGQDQDWLSFWGSGWFSLWLKNPRQARDALKYVCKWPEQAGLNAVVPHVMKLMHGLKASPAEIVEMLVPEHPLADDCEKEAMGANQAIWRKNFRLFISNLSHAEAWLEACQARFQRIYFPG